MANKFRTLEEGELDFSFSITVRVTGKSVSDYHNVSPERLAEINPTLANEIREQVVGEIARQGVRILDSQLIDYVTVDVTPLIPLGVINP